MSEVLAAALYMLVIGAVIYLVKNLSKWLSAQIETAKSEGAANGEQLKLLGLGVAEKAIKMAAEVTVGKLEALVAKDLRQQVKSGEADISDLQALAGQAYNEIMQTLNPQLMEVLSEGVRDVEQYIRNQIENQLRILKENRK